MKRINTEPRKRGTDGGEEKKKKYYEENKKPRRKRYIVESRLSINNRYFGRCKKRNEYETEKKNIRSWNSKLRYDLRVPTFIVYGVYADGCAATHFARLLKSILNCWSVVVVAKGQ